MTISCHILVLSGLYRTTVSRFIVSRKGYLNFRALILKTRHSQKRVFGGRLWPGVLFYVKRQISHRVELNYSTQPQPSLPSYCIDGLRQIFRAD